MAEEGISRPGSSAVASRIAIAPSLCRGSSPIHSCARAIECQDPAPLFEERRQHWHDGGNPCASAIRCELAPRIGAAECLPQRCFIRRDRPVVGGRFRQEFLKRPGILPLRYVILPGERVICPRRFPGGISLLASLISFSRPWSPIVSLSWRAGPIARTPAIPAIFFPCLSPPSSVREHRGLRAPSSVQGQASHHPCVTRAWPRPFHYDRRGTLLPSRLL